MDARQKFQKTRTLICMVNESEDTQFVAAVQNLLDEGWRFLGQPFVQGVYTKVCMAHEVEDTR